MTTVPREVWLLLILAAIITTLLGLIQTLGVLWMRDLVMRAIREQGFEPLRVRWRPLALWADRWGARGRTLAPTPFEGIYADATGATHQARFLVRLWPSRVRWIPPEGSYSFKPMSWFAQVVCCGISALCLYFGIKYLLAQELFLPPVLRNPRGVHLHGWSKNLLCLTLFCIAGSLLSGVVCRYRHQADERVYRLASRSCEVVGMALLWLSLGVYIYQSFAK